MLTLTQPRADYSDRTAKLSLVDVLSHIINGRGFFPYRPNQGSDEDWVLDSGNNWFLKFYPDNPKIFSIRYRYQSAGANHEAALLGWLKVRCSVEEVPQ